MALREWVEPAKVSSLLAQLATESYRCPARSCAPVPFGALAGQDRMRCLTCDQPLVRAKGEQIAHETAADFLAAPTVEATWGRARRMGPYLLLEEVGRGAMGVVFLARRDDLPRRLALKVVLTQENDPESLARFQREASVAARLQHPGIVGVYDVGREGRYRYYAMDYCDGKTLRELLREGPLPLLDAVKMVLELARALAYAHQNQVYHRDLKPANVLIDPHSGRPRVTDFGLAQDASRRERLTKTGDVLGTPLYMSPEQTVGQKGIDERVDVYALGVVLYECLTGVPPYMHPDPQQLFRMIREGKPDPPRKRRPEVPPELERICLRAMNANPDHRTAKATLLAAELEAFLEAPAPGPEPARRLQTWVVALGGLVAGVGVAIAFALSSGLEASPTLASASPTPGSSESPTQAPSAPPATPARLPPEVDQELDELAAAAVFPLHRQATPQLRRRFTNLRTRGQVLTERYPDDARAIFMGAVNEVLSQTSRDLEVRRELLRATRAEPALPDGAMNVAVLTLWTLGFARASADLCEQGMRRPRPDTSCALNLLHIGMKAAPPIRDLAGAIEISEAAIRLREQEHPGIGDRFLVPTWDLYCNVAELYLLQGDLEKAAARYESGARSTGESRRARAFTERAAALRAGRVKPDEGTRNVNTKIPFTPYLKSLASLERIEASKSGPAAADAALAEAAELQRSGQLAKAALILVHGGRAFLRADHVVEAIRTLRRAAQLDLAPQDADVRALVCRTLAYVLLLTPVGVSPSDENLAAVQDLAQEALAAAREKPEYFTRGEIADAWILLGRAEHSRGAAPAARAAYDAALALEPYDRRELDALGKSLGVR